MTASAYYGDGDTLAAPYIPEIGDTDTLGAALAYAAAGWYVLPVRDPKNPGSVVGKDWPSKSSCSPHVLTAWFAGTNYGIALHMGRSGAVAFDVDQLDSFPAEYRHLLKTALYQSSRPDQPGRGHYLFAQPPGRAIGNGKGRLRGGWGDVRGRNGVIIAAPSEPRYGWVRVGALPVLPNELAELLDDSAVADDSATDAAVAAFVAAHIAADDPDALNGLRSALAKKLQAGESAHASTVSVVTGALKEAAAGLYPARDALSAIKPLFLNACAAGGSSGNNPRTGNVAESEWRGIVAWAVSQARASDPAATRRRVGEKLASNVDEVDSAEFGGAEGEPSGSAFWSARPILTHIHRSAQARAAGPWGALGSVLVRATCAVPPHITLPPLVGSAMSLNLFAALLGISGLGKGAADAVGREAVRFVYAGLPSDPVELPLGTGEGVAKTFRQADAGPDDDAPTTAIFAAPEIDTVAALIGRQGATLEPELRKLYSGEQLGFTNAQKHTRTRVAAHSYRAGLIVGAQPERCGGLFRGTDGGTPQRFIWLPVNDPGAPDVLPEAPEPVTVRIPRLPHELTVPDMARQEILAHRRAMLRNEAAVDELDGHRLLSRLKIAAALMILDSAHRDAPGEITESDWELAGVVMGVSDQTREATRRAVESATRRANRARALDAAEREEVGEERRAARCREAILRWLDKAPGDGWMSRRDLRQKVKVNLRGYFDGEVSQLIIENRVEEGRSDRGAVYRAVHRYTIGTPQPTCENNGVPNGVPVYHPPTRGDTRPGKTARAARVIAAPCATAVGRLVDGNTATDSLQQTPPGLFAAAEATPDGPPLNRRQRRAAGQRGPATAAQSAAYVRGLCMDGCGRKPSAGRPRCEQCHRAYVAVVSGYDR